MELLKHDSSMDELEDYLLIVNLLINYIDEFCIKIRILTTTNRSCSTPKPDLSSSKLVQF